MTLPDRSFAAFLFDMDGTLVNSLAVVDRVWRAWAARHGIAADPLMAALHGVRAIETIRRFAPAGVDAEAETEALTQAEIDDVDGLAEIAGAAAFLSRLPADRWALVTSAPRALALRRLAAAGMALPEVVITAEDVVAAASGGTQAPAGDQRLPLRGIRREMFRSMTASLAVPQATAMIEADVSGTVQLLDTLKKRREFDGLRVSPLLVFARAACLAISRIPEINAGYDADADEIVLHGAVNLGIAAATPRGLLVPNIKNAERMNLTQLAEALNAMVAVAREGRV